MHIKKEQQQLLTEIKANIRKSSHQTGAYLGTTHQVYDTPVPNLRAIAKKWVTEHSDISYDDFFELVTVLIHAPSREEKVLASFIMVGFPNCTERILDKDFDKWMSQLTGWEEVDSITWPMNKWLFTNFPKRKKLLESWNRDYQIEKRRASLVILCRTVTDSSNKEIGDLAFEFIEKLKYEKNVMITKAISWLLRSLIKYHQQEVAEYIKANAHSLPAFAVREITNKLKTGKK